MNRSLLIGISIFISVLILTQYLAFQQYRITQIEQTKKLDEELNAVSDRLKKILSQSFSATKTLGFIVEQYGVPEDFQSIAKNIVSSYEYIDALELTQKGVITHVYPLEGNESALGLDVLSYPSSRAEAKKAIEKDDLFFAGPLELVQGGMAIIGRLPIYKENDFFGFAVVLIKLPNFIKAIGISNSESREFNYQLSKLNPSSRQEEYFMSDIIDEENDVVSTVDIADGEWKLYVSPKSTLEDYQQPIGTSILGLILSGLAGLFFFQWAQQPEKLSRLVEQKTREQKQAQEEAIKAAKDKETTLNRIRDGVISLDKNWNYKFINDAAAVNFPNGRKNAIGKNVLEINPDIIDTTFWDISKQALEMMTVREVESYYRPLDKWFAVKVYPSMDGTTLFYRDITEIKKIEKETMRMIGRELHDNVVQVLTGAGMFLNMGKRNANIQNKDLDKAEELIKKSIEEIRMLSHDLVSSFANGETLEDMIKGVFEHSTKAAGIQVQFHFDGLREDFLSKRLKTTIFRIIQEQCNNIIKYAEPKKVQLTISMDRDQIQIKIRDDGVGFDPDVGSSGIGFVNIRSRVALFNGKFEIDSSPGKGCEAKVSFPLPEQVIV